MERERESERGDGRKKNKETKSERKSGGEWGGVLEIWRERETVYANERLRPREKGSEGERIFFF